jgi:chromosome segregation ATPase
LLLALCCAPGVRAEPWYLISETELRSIEDYQAKSEQERQSWLVQVRELRTRAESLEAHSANLNWQLTGAREAQRKLEQSFNASEAGWLTRLSLKNGEIAELNQRLAKHRGKNAIIIALGAAWIIAIAFKAYRFFRK